MAETKRQFSGRQQKTSDYGQRNAAHDQKLSEFAHRIHFYRAMATFYLKFRGLACVARAAAAHKRIDSMSSSNSLTIGEITK
jgi:hypothetical protein